MDRIFATLFPINVPSNFKITLRVLNVREPMPRDNKSIERLNRWAGRLWRVDLKVPVKPYFSFDKPSFLIPSFAVNKCRELTFNDVPNMLYHLDLSNEEITVDLAEEDPVRRGIVCNLLERALTDRVCHLGQLWRWHWTLFFKSIPENVNVESRLVDCYRGVKFSVLWGTDGLFLAADVRTKYISRRSLADYLASGDTSEISSHLALDMKERRSRFVRDNVRVRFSCIYRGETGLTASTAKFLDSLTGMMTSVKEYYQSVYNIELPDNDVVVFAASDEHKDAVYVPASRLFPAFDTEQVRDMHSSMDPVIRRKVLPPPPQLPPEKRMDILIGFIKEIGKFSFGDFHLHLSYTPHQKKCLFFTPPNLVFGNGQVLKYQPASNPTTEILNWTRRKMPSIYRHGVYEVSDFPRFAAIMPQEWSQPVRMSIIKNIQQELSKITKRAIHIPEQKLYRNLPELIRFLTNPLGRIFFIIGLSKKLPLYAHDLIKKQPGVMSQCFSYNTGQRIAAGESSFVRNLCLSILIDIGAKPWILGTPLNYEVYIGIDVLQNRAAFHFFWGEYADRMLFLPGQSTTQARNQEAIKRPHMAQTLIEGLKHIVEATGRPITSLAVHRDGTWWPSEQGGLEHTLKVLRADGTIAASSRIAVVEVRKTHIPIRLVSIRPKPESYRRSVFVNPVPGVYWVLDSENIILCCASRPLAWDGPDGRTAGTLLLRHVYSENGFDIISIGQDAYFLSQLNWSAPNIEINIPVTIRWADDRLREQLLRDGEIEDMLECEDEVIEGDLEVENA